MLRLSNLRISGAMRLVCILCASLSASLSASAPVNASVDHTTLFKMVDFAKIAYCLPYTGGNVVWDCIECVTKYPGVKVTPFGMGTIAGSGAYGYVAHDVKNHDIIVSFAGTSDAIMELRDLECGTTNAANASGKVFKGPYIGYKDHRDRIVSAVKTYKKDDPSARLLVTGHSLGGTQSYYGTYDLAISGLKPTLYSLAPMRPGDREFAEEFLKAVGSDNIHRITHYLDPVPHYPPDIARPDCSQTDWRHVGTEIHYGMSVEKNNHEVCSPGVEDRTDKTCGSNKNKYIDLFDPLTAEYMSYHLCYPGQCGVPAALGLPCVAVPPFCLSPATGMGNCATGNILPLPPNDPEDAASVVV